MYFYAHSRASQRSNREEKVVRRENYFKLLNIVGVQGFTAVDDAILSFFTLTNVALNREAYYRMSFI